MDRERESWNMHVVLDSSHSSTMLANRFWNFFYPYKNSKKLKNIIPFMVGRKTFSELACLYVYARIYAFEYILKSFQKVSLQK